MALTARTWTVAEISCLGLAFVIGATGAGEAGIDLGAIASGIAAEIRAIASDLVIDHHGHSSRGHCDGLGQILFNTGGQARHESRGFLASGMGDS